VTTGSVSDDRDGAAAADQGGGEHERGTDVPGSADNPVGDADVPLSEAGVVPETATGPETEPAPGSDAESESAPDPDAGRQTAARAVSGSESGAGGDAESDSVLRGAPRVGAESAADRESGPRAEADSEAAVVPDSETASGAERAPAAGNGDTGAREDDSIPRPAGSPADEDAGSLSFDAAPSPGGVQAAGDIPAGRHRRPTSRRGRAAIRRGRQPRTVPGVTGEILTVEASVPGLLEPRTSAVPRSPAGPRGRERLRRRRAALLAGMGALTLAGVGLAVAGLSTVRHSTAGRYEQALAPDDPGYQALVVPTPTMGVLHRGADGDLVGASLIALEPGDAGGSVILVPPATIVPGPRGDTTIAAAYRDRGADGAAEALGLAVTVGVSEYVEVDDAQWADLVDPIGSVEVTLDEAVGEWPAGPVTLEPAEVGPFLSARAGDETDLDRIDRQMLFWDAWLPLVEGGGSEVLPGEVDTGIGRFVRGVAQADGSAAALPVRRDEGAGGVRFRTDVRRVGEFVSRTVPYPTAPAPGSRIRVRLLNGTENADLTTVAARALVAAGAQISIAGNASTLDVAETSFVSADADREPLAVWLKSLLGGGRVEQAPTGQDGQIPSDDEIDVTVILGEDARDLIER
jgi:LytR cell envelope-related transcriptional attenuator/LytR_cpsA_psr family